MKNHSLNLLLGPPEIADLLRIPEATVNALVSFGHAPKPTRSLNGKRLKWKQIDIPAWLRAVDRLRGQGKNNRPA